ncbi:MAG: HD domain-containing protein [Candidatus Diapherotrites archaeon]|nr:HD domain-containing protein [Candidatus Diapherotrites archaeon]
MIFKKKKGIPEYKANEEVKDIFVARFTKEVKLAKNNNYYFEVKIQDALGDAMLKYWGGSDQNKVQEVYSQIKEDSIIYIEGRTSEYHEKIDFGVNEGKLQVLKETDFDISDFIRKSEKDTETMLSELKKLIEQVQNPELKLVLEKFFANQEFVQKFKQAPAAMYIHHGWVSGLLEHTLAVTGLSLEVAKYHPELDKDLLITGAILHDIGKIEEFATTTQIKVTDKGNLLGHTTIGTQALTRVLDKLDISESTKNKLLHIIISHHGSTELGCPKAPAFPEALVISKIDELNANITEISETMKTAQTSDSFAYNKHFGNIYLK